MPGGNPGLAVAETLLRSYVFHGVSEKPGMELFFANGEVNLKRVVEVGLMVD